MNFLKEILPIVKKTISSGYYEKMINAKKRKRSLAQAIRSSKQTPIIAELKPESPSNGDLLRGRNAREVMNVYASNGACAISVLTEPEKFGGDLKLLEEEWGVPLLQKDFIASERQINPNADAVLLIAGFCKLAKANVNELIEKAHAKKIEVLLEVHSLEEFSEAVKTNADVIGINNRSLATLKTSMNTTINILARADKKGKLVVSESGFSAREEIRRALKAGADAVLVGTSLMKSESPAEKLRELAG